MSNYALRLVKAALCLLVLLCLPLWSVVSAKRQTPKIDFQRDIQPILAAACVQCHSAKKAAGQLRLDVKSAALKGGISGLAIVPGRSRQSRLLARILGEGGEQRM